jgi:RNA polymerase sigma-70 factor (ECF subfamily)
MLQAPHTKSVHNGQSSDPPRAGSDAIPSWELVAAAQRGDREAFGHLYARHAPQVSRFVASRVSDRTLAQDLTSETFLRALRRIDSVHDQGTNVGAWFTTIARNLIVDHLKSSRHRREQLTADVGEGSTHQDSPEQAVIRKHTVSELHRCVDHLPSDQQECVRLRFLRELSVAETAARMGRSAPAIKALTHRGIKALRAAMTHHTDPIPLNHGRAEPLARARRAVAELQHHRATRDRHTTEQHRARQLAHWRTEDHDSARHREHTNDHGALSAEGDAP